jgi:hypothetical protein
MQQMNYKTSCYREERERGEREIAEICSYSLEESLKDADWKLKHCAEFRRATILHREKRLI